MDRVCFIGHRQIIYDEKVRERLKAVVEQQIKSGYKCFMMGNHGDFDKMALSVCRELRKKYTDIKIEVVLTSFVPLKKQVEDDEWGHYEFNQFDDVETVMFEIEEEHFKCKITKSNREMIDVCNLLVCFVNETKRKSGALTTMKYAKQKNLKIINIYRVGDV